MSDDLTARQCSCHCGAVRFSARLPHELHGMRCTCSICSIKGVVMVAVGLEDLEIIEGEDLLTCYQFNTMAAKHFFCSRCGIHCFHQRRSDPSQYGVNAACIQGVSPFDFASVPVADGINHPKDHGGKFRRAGTLHFEPASP